MNYHETMDLERLLRFHDAQSTTHAVSSLAAAIFCIIIASLLFNVTLSSSSRTYNIHQKTTSMLKDLVLSGLGYIGLPVSAFAKTSLPGFRTKPLLCSIDANGDGRPSLPAGLQNPANGCFQNSVIQGLASLRSLPTFLDRMNEWSMQEADTTGGLLVKIFQLLNEGNSSRTSYRLPPKLSNMNVWQQQDAQEYYTKLYDRVEEEAIESQHQKTSKLGLQRLVGNSSPQNPSIQPFGRDREDCLSNPLEGLQAQRVSCMSCGFSEGLNITPFNCLTLQLEGYGIQRLDQLLTDWTKLDYIEDVECANCTLKAKQKLLKDVIKDAKVGNAKSTLQTLSDTIDEALRTQDFSEETLLKKCNIPKNTRLKRTKTKQVVIARPPRALVVHFNRSIFTQYGDQVKNNAPIHFEPNFDMRPWCLGPSEDSASKERNFIEHWNMEPAVSMLPNGTLAPSEPSSLYQLRAVVQHQGSADNGHYVCYRKFKSDEKDQERWFVMNDAYVYLTDESRVLSEHGTFMLFYERSEEPAIGPALGDVKDETVADLSESAKTPSECDSEDRRVDSVIASQRSSVELSELPTIAASA